MTASDLILNDQLELTPLLWSKLISENKISSTAGVVEVAPGYEVKIGRALAMLQFRGTIFVIEPDAAAANYIKKAYQDILPQAVVTVINKPLHLVASSDIQKKIEAVLASHSFDDMVMGSLVDNFSFFTKEHKDGLIFRDSIKKIYQSFTSRDYEQKIKITEKAWKDFIASLKPRWFIASQYPSRILAAKALTLRQNSGFAVLNGLREFYKKSLQDKHYEADFGYRGDPKWWINANLAKQKNDC